MSWRGTDPAEYRSLVECLLELFQPEIRPLLETIGQAMETEIAR